MKKSVLVGMSGGVDSSLSVYLLLQKGYHVEGASLLTCGNDISLARRIAEYFRIPFHVIDVEREFRKKIIEYSKEQYLNGMTPNPCVICNREVKFQSLIEKANDLNIQYVATGHYVRKGYNIFNKRHTLHRAKDLNKDQSYMLYNLSQEQISRSIFPLGKYDKKRVREIASKIGLEVAEKADSQDICFSLEKKDKLGNIVDMKGKLLGRHDGISNFTIGQRKGILISAKDAYYVVGIDPKSNSIIVGSEDNIYGKRLIAKDVNWVSIPEPKGEIKTTAKIRYRAEQARATLTPRDNNRVEVVFEKPQRAITKGQSVVFYKNNLLLGGGMID